MAEPVHPTTDTSGQRIGGILTSHAALVQDRVVIDDMNATTDWTVLGNDTTTLAQSDEHVLGTNSLSFAKVNGAANTVNAGIQKTITSVDLSRFGAGAAIEVLLRVTDKSDVDKAFVRLGTDSSNYNEWLIDDDDITINIWDKFLIALSATEAVVGDGWDQSAVTYVAVGLTFDLETDALAAILFDQISILGEQTNRVAS